MFLMFSPADDQEEGNVFDQLRSIRPFTVDQLYLLHPDVGCPQAISATSGHDNDENKSTVPDKEVYKDLVEYEQLRNRLVDLKHDVKKLYKKTYENIDKAWTFNEETLRKIAMCQQGKIAETTFKYNTAHLDKKHLDRFASEFSSMVDLITQDFTYYSFECQVKRQKIVTQLAISYQTTDRELSKARLKSAIVTLIEFLKYLSDNKPILIVQCRKWLRALCKRYLDRGTTIDYQFIISQLAKGPVGTADWSADLVECKPYEQVTGFESVPQYITHCSTILSELFYSLQLRIKHLKATKEATSTSKNESGSNSETNNEQQQNAGDQNWSLVDPRFSCTEELNVSSSNSNLLSEMDVIKFCLKIPVAQIFRAYVKKCLDSSNEFHLETDKNYEFIMLKLLTIGTIIIKTYQIGLETFDSIQYGNLIEYLSSQTRRTVVILSDQWSEFKRRLRGIDDALLMRLQVEYDNFMLRSILIILELRECGIWRHLSRVEREVDEYNYDESSHNWATDSLRPAFAKFLQVTGISTNQLRQQSSQDNPAQASTTAITLDQDLATTRKPTTRSLQMRTSSSLTYEFSIEWFKDVSEPMLWHILWQFYHNAFVSSCDYHSDNYWLKKFQEKSVVYLFVNKMKDSPPGECSYLLNSLTSMLLSRNRSDSKLVQFIATEIFNLTFKNKSLKEKISNKGIRSLVRCAKKFPNLVSLYLQLMIDQELDSTAMDLIKGCSLKGWICNELELALIERWLIDFPLEAPQNRISRLIISKLLLNSPNQEDLPNDMNSNQDESMRSVANSSTMKRKKQGSILANCFVHLKMRRHLALVLYHASVQHISDQNQFGPMSLGASVEVGFGDGLFCESTATNRENLIELATDPNYQQFYIWLWRVLFSLRLHILHQPETDWNDLQSRSGTGRSTKNTVLVNDSFHPVTSINDSECSALSEGVKSQNPVASFIYLMLTDVTWQADTVDSCLLNLNTLANSGHITPSLMAMKFFTVCHLNDLPDNLANQKKFIDYFTTVFLSNFDATHLASLIMTQLDRLKQYRQLQLSNFYIKVFLEVSWIIVKRLSSSWFSSNEICLEKIACVLDFLVRFNFSTQRTELVKIFYNCAYMIQDQQQNPNQNGWLGSLLNSNTTQQDFLTILHRLAQKSRKYAWLQWVTTECDAIRLEKVWEDIVTHLSTVEDATIEHAIKKCGGKINAALLKSALPIYSWTRQIFEIMELDLNHPLCPFIWYNFFLNYFANSLNGVSVGVKLVSQETLARLMTRLDSLYNYHLFKQRNWSSTSATQQTSLTQLYRAYKLWLQDPSLRDAYVDIDRLRDDYLVSLLKAVMESSNASVCLQYVDLDSIETQNKNLTQVWIASTRSIWAESLYQPDDSIFYVDRGDCHDLDDANDETADDAASLIGKSLQTKPSSESSSSRATRLLDDGHEELGKPLSEDAFFKEAAFRTLEELMAQVKDKFKIVFEESTGFEINTSELNRTKTEIVELVSKLYINKRREFLRVVPCIEGHECAGPARIKLEADEALLDERRSQCIQDRRRQCQELIGELLLTPKSCSVEATIMIEEHVHRLVGDPVRSKAVIEGLLHWLSEPNVYKHLISKFHIANHLLKTILEILSTSNQIDTFNSSLIQVFLDHPESVQIFSPYLSPSSCTTDCFLHLYKTICSRQRDFGSMATFVVLSKFDINAWLASINPAKGTKGKLHEIIVTTCSAFKDIGKNPDESQELIMDLFKRHLQIELAPPNRRTPEELLLVVNQFLKMMDCQALAPNLWLDLLAILGLDYHSNLLQQDARRMNIVSDNVARLAECQLIFDYQSLCALVKTISEHSRLNGESLQSAAILGKYPDYIEQYCLFRTTITFMWIKSTSDAGFTESHDLIWTQFMGIWRDWVMPLKKCPNKLHYNLTAFFFVSSLQYLTRKLADFTPNILQSLLSELTNYIQKLEDNLNVELAILQRCLMNLPWSNLSTTPTEIDNLAKLSEQENYNLADIVAHIMLKIDIRDTLVRMEQHLPYDSMGQTAERLAQVIIRQANHLKGFRLPTNYLSAIDTRQVPNLADLVLARLDLINLDHSHSNKILMDTLTCICIRRRSPEVGSQANIDHNDTNSLSALGIDGDSYERAIVFAHFVSRYLVELMRRNPSVASSNKKYLERCLDGALSILKSFLYSTNGIKDEQPKKILRTLLECCSVDELELDTRLMLARLFANSQSWHDRQEVVFDLVYWLADILRQPKVLVNTVEALLESYQLSTGHLDDLGGRFYPTAFSVETYLDACIQNKTPFALLVFFESQFNLVQCQGEDAPGAHSLLRPTFRLDQIWASYWEWLSNLLQASFDPTTQQLSISGGAHKLTTLLVLMLVRLEKDLKQLLAVQTTPTESNVSSSPSLVELDTQETKSADQSDKVGERKQSDKSIETASLSSTATKKHPKFEVEMSSVHAHLINMIKNLIALYDSLNPSGLWSYLKTSNKSVDSTKISITSLAIACFLTDRLLRLLASASSSSEVPTNVKSLRDELTRLRQSGLAKLEGSKKLKNFVDCGQFIETIIGSVQQNDKVQYSDVIELIATFLQQS